MKFLKTTLILIFIIFLYKWSKDNKKLISDNSKNLIALSINSKRIPVDSKPILKLELNNDVKVRKKIHLDMNSFMDSIGFKESSNKYDAVNRLGYKGRYQFGGLALKDLNLISRKDFLENKNLQDLSFISLCRINKFRLRKEIKAFVGDTINNIKITESGLLAAAHLVGYKSVRKYLKSNGSIIRHDANKMSLETYLSRFSGYDLNIKPIKTVNLKNKLLNVR